MRKGMFTHGTQAPPPRRLAGALTATCTMIIVLIAVTGTALAGGGSLQNSLSFTFTFDPERVVVTRDRTTGFDFVSYPGLTAATFPDWESAPMLPAIHEAVLLPPRTRIATVNVLLADRVLVPGDIRPVPIPPQSGDTTGTWDTDPIYYQDGGTFPPDPRRLTGNERFREFCVGSVLAMPFEWTGSRNELALYRSVEITITLRPEPADVSVPPRLRPEHRFSVDGWELEWLRESVTNPNDLDAFYSVVSRVDRSQDQSVTESTASNGFHPTDRPSLEGPPVELVIVTNDVFANGQSLPGAMSTAFQRLADWRTKTGRPSAVRTLTWIRNNYPGTDDAERIRNFLEDAYSKWGTDYVILGGDSRIVPARMTTYTFTGDAPSDWYYADLDNTWNLDGDGHFEWTVTGVPSDKFPELWVGRLPARDATEAAGIVTKILTYERYPDAAYGVPPDVYYSRALLAAGLTNETFWEGSEPKKWRNGIYASEQITTQVLATAGFSTQRLYPDLGGTVGTCLGQTLPCYDIIKANVLPSYPPSAYFTANELYTQLNSYDASIFFHMEHSNPHVLGGPVDQPANTALLPKTTTCLDVQGCQSPECDAWASTCFGQYNTNNPKQHFTRELAEKLTNGPEYVVGLTLGSLTGRHEVDAIDEVLVRNPIGGAVAMCGKVASYNPWVVVGQDSVEISVNFFKRSLIGRKPVGVALYSAVQSYMNQHPAESANRVLHLFGDPSMRVWSAVPKALQVTSNPASLEYPSFKRFDVTVRDYDTGVVVPNARVCLYRGTDVYATTLTNASGVAVFPHVLIQDTADTVHVYATADNAVPAHIYVPPSTAPVHISTISYFNHTFAETLSVGYQTDLIEAGDEVSLAVALVPNGAIPGANVKLTPTPRVRARLRVDGVYAPTKILIGGGVANPPALADTFSLSMNEYGIRVEDLPVSSLTGAFYLWRDTDAVYHVLAKYSGADLGKPFTGTLLVDGGVELTGTTLDPEDSYTITNGAIDKVDFSFVGDASNDELTFRAQAMDWVQMLDADDTLGPLGVGQSGTARFLINVLSAVPPRTRLNFSVRAGTTSSDFYLRVAAPDVGLTFLETQSLMGDCVLCGGGGSGIPRWALYPTVRNTGDGATEVRLSLTAAGTGITVCTSQTQQTVAAGAEVKLSTPFEFCCAQGALSVQQLLIERRENTTWIAEEAHANLNPWGHTREVESVVMDPIYSGFRVSWVPPTDLTSIRGYHVLLDSAAVRFRLKTDLGTDASQLEVRSRNPGTTYRAWVGAVDKNFTRGPLVSSYTQKPTLKERAGWPKRVPKGFAKSIALVNLDEDVECEIVLGGRVITAWNGDGTSATTNPSGLVYDPYPSTVPTGRTSLWFQGEIAAADIDADQKVELVGVYGDDKLNVVDFDGTGAWTRSCRAFSAPTLADLDRDGKHEILVNSYESGTLYVWRFNGGGYRCTDGTFATLSGTDVKYNFAGLAVADLDVSSANLEIIHPAKDGHVRVWKTTNPSCLTSPVLFWDKQLPVPTGVYPLSTPSVARFTAGGPLDVVVNSSAAWRAVTVLNGTNGDDRAVWDAVGFPVSFESDPVQPPSVMDLHFPLDGLPELVIGQSTDLNGWDPETTTYLCYRVGSTLKRAACLDSIPVPGRRDELKAKTLGWPILVNIDGDLKPEILQVSNQGGLYCWEPTWNATTSTFTCVPEKGWPIVFEDQPGTVAVGNIDTDYAAELIVAVDDGYVHAYDLPSAMALGSWAAAAHDPRRTGNVEGGGGGTFAPPPPGGDLTLQRTSTVRGNPSTGAVRFELQVPFRTAAQIELFDLAGRRIRELRTEHLDPGTHLVSWDAQNDHGEPVADGIYFARVSIGPFESTEKIVVKR